MKPYGAALRAFHAGRHDAGIRLRSSLGEDEIVPAAIFFRENDDLFWFELQAFEMARGTVLDLGAGAGPHALELQRRGFDVLAVENCAPLVEIMRERGVRHAIRRDFRWWRGPTFETVLMLMNGVGPTATVAGLDRFLAHARGLLAQGGQLLVDSAEAVPEGRPGGEEGWPAAGGYPGQAWIDLEFDGDRGLPFRELYADADTLRDRAERAGWATEVAAEADGAFLLRLTLR
ncbi:MAG: class I SAM-dependent methyltransferase [Gemmatimonadota bacterium]|nr:class I SAM-dependent methyltransferase [Gemmatimonadota bacterium]